MKKLGTLILLFSLALVACGSNNPLERLKKELGKHPEYSIILEDMREDGNFFKDYFHRYKLVYAKKGAGTDSLVYNNEVTDWYEVEKKFYTDYSNYLGMVIASKSPNGKVDNSKYPPGYQYVGNQNYGNWRTDNRGTSFWEWYGKYALFSSMFGMFNRPVYQNDWNGYRDYRNNYGNGGGAYYGRGNAYGTNGSHTKKTKPNFYQRKATKERARKSSFSDRVKQRTRRSNMSSVRSRSRGSGK